MFSNRCKEYYWLYSGPNTSSFVVTCKIRKSMSSWFR